MPSIAVLKVTGLPPAISITMSGTTTYEQFKASLGDYVYYVNKAYLFSTNLQQIQGSFLFDEYDANGNQNQQNIISAISPYQSANSIFLDLKDKKLILNGREFITFTMLPNTTLSLKLYTDRISVGDELDEKGINTFIQYETSEGSDFFDDYDEYL